MEKRYKLFEYEEGQDRPFDLLRLNVPVFHTWSLVRAQRRLRTAQKSFLLTLRRFIDEDIERFSSR